MLVECEIVAKMLRRARRVRGETLDAVASRAGVARSAIHRAEQGRSESVARALSICGAVGLTIERPQIGLSDVQAAALRRLIRAAVSGDPLKVTFALAAVRDSGAGRALSGE